MARGMACRLIFAVLTAVACAMETTDSIELGPELDIDIGDATALEERASLNTAEESGDGGGDEDDSERWGGKTAEEFNEVMQDMKTSL